MTAWSVLVSADRFAAERLYRQEVLEIVGLPGAEALRPTDQVALIADIEPPIVFALATVAASGPFDPDDPGAEEGGPTGDHSALRLSYTMRLFDAALPAAGLAPVGGSIREISADAVDAIKRAVPVVTERTWLVSLDMPIEAASAAEAVRQFWTYVRELGPAELPAFVSPTDDELSMQAFVLGDEANQDPEED